MPRKVQGVDRYSASKFLILGTLRCSRTMAQPFYHRMEVLFTATADLSDRANTPEFKRKLAAFLKEHLGSEVKAQSVGFDGPVDAEPGDPQDLA
jgi:hypothetical protein